jgi:hypothetical protein
MACQPTAMSSDLNLLFNIGVLSLTCKDLRCLKQFQPTKYDGFVRCDGFHLQLTLSTTDQSFIFSLDIGTLSVNLWCGPLGMLVVLYMEDSYQVRRI